MQKITKSVLSVLVIVFFLVITLATQFEDFLLESTNTTVKIENCEDQPQVIGTITVAIIITNDDDEPLSSIDGKLFVTHQKVNTDSCTFEVVFNEIIPFETNSQGVFIYQGPEWAHDNSQDLWRAEVEIESDEFNTGYSDVQVKYYSEADFTFSATLFQ